MRLETERLVLRSVVPSDASNLHLLYSDPEVMRFLPPGPPVTLEQAQQRVERRMKMEAELGYAPFIILKKDSGEFIGSGGVQPVKDTTDVEIAYHFLPSAWGKGYATEAAVAILDFGFRTVGLREIVAVAYPDNTASWRVLEKIGMRDVGIAKYHGIGGLKKYVANRESWTPPRLR